MSVYLRTPESRFSNLPNFNFKPNYVNLPSCNPYRMAYIDEKTSNYNGHSINFLCLHGVPTYSYLYRKIIPVLLDSNKFHQRGVRVICPDFIGFGRSDKPTNINVHKISFHRQSLVHFIQYLKLKNITLICQDWGGIIGLTLPLHFSNAFNRIIFFNTSICDGTQQPTKGFINWRKYATTNPDINVSKVMGRANPNLSQSELNGYAAPFFSAESKLSLRAWPAMVPISPHDNGMNIQREAYFFYKQNQVKLNNGDFENAINIFQAHGCLDIVFTVDTALKMNKYMCRNGGTHSDNVRLGTSMQNGAILWVPNAGHFVQESADIHWVIGKALKYFGDIPYNKVEYEYLLTSKTNIFIAKLLLNAPPVHALSNDVMIAVRNIVQSINDQTMTANMNSNSKNGHGVNINCRGIILTANTKQRIKQNKYAVFSAGFDLRTFAAGNEEFTKEYFRNIGRAYLAFHKSNIPIIAALNGYCTAGGTLLAIACDYRIGFASTVMQMSEARDGLGPGGKTLAEIERVVGSGHKAAFIVQTAVPFKGKEAVDIGLLDEILDECDDGNNVKLMAKCVDVLEKKYFYAQYFGAAQSRMASRQNSIERTESDFKEEAIQERTDGFLKNKPFQKYIKKLLKRNTKSKL